MVVLLGDSHLARIRRDLAVVHPSARNLAVGGATAIDLAAQVTVADVVPDCVAVVSVGTNDAAPLRAVSIGEFADALSRCFASSPKTSWVFLAPPGVVEDRQEGRACRTNAVIDRYRDAGLAVCQAAEAVVVRADLLVADAGPHAFAMDGIHLSGWGYRRLLPALTSAVALAGTRAQP